MNSRLLRTFAFLVVGVVILSALIVSVCDPARRMSERTVAGPSSSEPAPPGAPAKAVADGANGVTITFRPAVPSATATARDPHLARPPYPWALAESVRRTVEALHRSVDLDYDNAKLDDILDHIAELLGVTIRDLAGDERDKTITFQMRELEGRHVLSLLLRQYGLTYVIDDDGSILVGSEDQVVRSEALRVRGQLESARDRERGDNEWAAKTAEEERSVGDALRRARVEVPAEEHNALDWVSLVREQAQVNFVIRGDATAPAEATRFALPTGAWSAEEVVREIAARAGMGRMVQNGVTLLGDAERIEDERRKQEEKLAAVRECVGRPIAFAVASLPSWRLAEELRAQTGLPVVVDEAVWNREAPLAVPVGGCGLGDAMDRVAAENGLTWRLLNGTVYVYPP